MRLSLLPPRSALRLKRFSTTVRYIALVALVKIAPTHPHLISTHFDTILQCTDDADLSVRMRALDLVEVMVRHALVSLVAVAEPDNRSLAG